MEERIIRVTPAQVAAAKLRIKRDQQLGRETTPAVAAIALAHRQHADG